MLDGEIVAYLTIVGGSLLSAACYVFVARHTGIWLMGVDAALGIVGNCFTLVPAAYFLLGVVVEVGRHLIVRGDPPTIPMSGNEPTLVLVFAYAIFLCVGSNFRISQTLKAGAAKRVKR